MIGQVGATGAAIIALEVVIFVMAVFHGRLITYTLGPQLRRLSSSLREYHDEFDDQDNFVTRARTRYRRALGHIENVNPHLVVDSIFAEAEATKILGKRISYSQFEQIYKSVPSTLVTLGLLGTFIGLSSNLGELSAILDSSQSSPTDSLQRASGILEPMATAFLTSLVGVALSVLLWIIGSAQGTHTIINDARELTSAYLDQIVQANSKRFSLLKESVDRMEGYMSEFLANFSDRIGRAIDHAMREKIGQVFDSIKSSAESYSHYVSLLDDGCKHLSQSAERFHRASEVFAASDFAEKFGESTSVFMLSTSTAANSISSLIASSKGLDEQIRQTRVAISEGSDICASVIASSTTASQALTTAIEAVHASSLTLTEATTQLQETRVEIGRDARSNESILNQTSKALVELESLSVRLLELATQINESVPSGINAISAEISTIRSSIESSLQALLSTDRDSKLNSQTNP